jgi:small GTP-binding protein
MDDSADNSAWRDELQLNWEDLPKQTRDEIERALERLPGGLKGWRDLIDQAVHQVRLAAGTRRSIAILGPANAGKSTLYNALIRASERPAEVSAIPGTTREVQRADAGIFALLDTPGTDSAGDLGEVERDKALRAASDSDLVVLLFDASHGVREPERQLYRDLSTLGKPLVVALNKIDLIGKERPAMLAQAGKLLDLKPGDLSPISALQRQGLDKLLLTMVRREPEILAALGEALPAYRWKLAQAVIARGASAAGAIGLTPLPFVDFIPLLGIQVAMVLGIARVFTYRITLSRARELIATFGMGALGRTLFYELSKLGGPPSWLLAAGVAAGTTATLGYSSALWFDRGEELTNERLKALAASFSEGLIGRLKGIGKRRPSEAELRQQVGAALKELGEGTQAGDQGRGTDTKSD